MDLAAHAPVSAGSARVSTLHVHVSLSYAVLLHWVFAEVIVDGRSLFFLCPEPSLLPCSADALDAAGPAKKKPGESVHVQTCRAVPCGFDAAWDLMPLWAVPAARRRLWSAWLAMVEPPSCDSLTVLLCWQRRLVCICMPKPLRLRSRTRL